MNNTRRLALYQHGVQSDNRTLVYTADQFRLLIVMKRYDTRAGLLCAGYIAPLTSLLT